MSNQNQIDDLFKNHFDSFEVPVKDREGLWRKIAGKDHSRRLLLWLFCGVGLASITWVVSAGTEFENQGKERSVEISTEASELVQKSNETRVKTLVSIIEESEKEEPLTNESQIEKTIDLENDESDIVDGIEEGKNASKSKYEKKGSYDQKSRSTGDNVTRSSSQVQNSNLNLRDDASYRSEQKRNQSSQSEESSIPFTKVRKNSESNERKKKDPIELGMEMSRMTSRSFDLLENNIKDLIATRPGLMEKYNSKLVCTINGKDGAGGHIYFDLYAGLSLSLDQVRLNQGFRDELAYRDAWIDRYTTLPSVSAGAAVGYETAGGIGLSGGIEYQRLESQYRTTQTVTEIITVYDPMAYFYYDDNNEIVWVADSVTAVSRYDRTISLGSKTHLLSVPVQVTVPIVFKNGWNVKALLGGAFNFSMTHRGHHLRDDLVVDPVTSANEGVYMNQSIGVSVDGGLHFGRYLSERLELYISPRYRYNKTSYLNRSEPLSVSRDFVSIRSGVRYHFQ